MAKLNIGSDSKITTIDNGNNTGNHTFSVSDVGGWASMGIYATSGSTAAINTTETIVASTTVGTGVWLSGVTFKMHLIGVCTSSVANVSTFTIRAGTAGTTADASIATVTVTAATSGTSIPFVADIVFAVSSTGTTGAISGAMTLINGGTTGINTTNAVALNLTTTSTLNTTTATKLEVTYKSAATTTTSTFNPGTFIQLVKN